MLYLVRHAMPHVERNVPPERWHLGADGRRAAARLVQAVPRDATFVASAEPKAVQTLAGVDPRIDARLNEVYREGEPFGGSFRELRRAWVQGTRHETWEAHDDAAGRFMAAVDDARAQGPGDVVIATHGMVVSNWLVAVGVLGRQAAGEFWAALTLPDCWVLDGGRLERVFSG